VALLWVVHPLTTAAVTYTAQRVESLMSLFYLLTLYSTIRASEGTGRAGWWSAAAILSCALGMATKETMVTAPVVAGIWLWIFAPPNGGARWQGRHGLMSGLAATWLVLALLVYGERRGPSIEYAWGAVQPYLLAQAQVVVHYLRLVFVPSPLVFLYDWPLVTSLGAAAWQVLLVAALAAATIGGVARRHPASFLGASFFLILAPSSSILPIVTEVAAEHRMYLPLAAVIAGVVCAVVALGRRLGPPPRVAAGAAMIAVAVCAIALAAETRARNRVYWSAESLWADTVTKRPGDMRAKVAYAEALAIAGKLPEAEAQLRAAVTLAPENGVARVRLGSALAAQGRYGEAEGELKSALALLPDDPDAHRFLGEIYAAHGRDVDAVRHFEQALAALPGDPRLTGRLAYLLARSPDPLVRNLPRARELLREAVRLTGGRDPRLVELLNQLDALR
jgi:Flp pilus assembly protein TadD